MCVCSGRCAPLEAAPGAFQAGTRCTQSAVPRLAALSQLCGHACTNAKAVSASQYCGGGELYGLLMSQPNKRLQEAHMKFYVAEILLALQYLHLLGFVYRCFPVSPHALSSSDNQCSTPTACICLETEPVLWVASSHTEPCLPLTVVHLIACTGT